MQVTTFAGYEQITSDFNEEIIMSRYAIKPDQQFVVTFEFNMFARLTSVLSLRLDYLLSDPVGFHVGVGYLDVVGSLLVNELALDKEALALLAQPLDVAEGAVCTVAIVATCPLL